MQVLRRVVAVVVPLFLLSFACAVRSETLTLERLHAAPDLSGTAPRGLQVAPDGSRVGFLRGRDDNPFQLDLWEYHVAEGRARRLLDSKALQPEERPSDAERARRERQHTGAYAGIVDYTWAPDGRRLLVPLADALLLVDPARPGLVRRIAGGDVIDAQISPRGRYVSFVRAQDLWVVELETGHETRLTHDGGGTVHNAEAEFVAQEEMDQHGGYWWAPDDSAIAYKRYDEAPVTVARRFEVRAGGADVVEQRYPAAGERNVLVSLHIVAPDGSPARRVDLGPDPDIYLVRADWSADGRLLAYQRQSRDQKRLELVAVDAATLAQRTLVTETSPAWVSVLGKPHFLKKQAAFVWQSERSGRRHAWLIGLDGRVLHAISAGDWMIDGVLAVDEDKGLVYVDGWQETPLERQVYALPLDGSAAAAPARITREAGWHVAAFSERADVFVDTWSDPQTPPQVSLRRADGTRLAWIERNALDEKHPYWRYRDAHVPVEFGTLAAEDGQAMHYALRKPPGFDPSRRYPVFVPVYGGPGAQTVRRAWGNLFEQYMAQQGYVVFMLDNRGSARRERAFTDVIRGELGRHEVADQLRGIGWLARQPWVDPKRIGVYGWSYGGFMTLRLLSAASDRLAAGVAGAPVTDWALYDTHYAEQFMGRPQDNPRGYRDGGVFAHLGGLRAPLLLIHGMADDNVLFTNTTRLIDDLATRGTLFRLMTYPGEKHGFGRRANRLHRDRTIDAFFREMLAPGR